MGDFALVLCPEECEENAERGNLLKDFFNCLNNNICSVFKKQNFRIEFKKINIYDCLNIYLMTLPFDMDKLSHLKKKQAARIGSLISRFSIENNVKNCILPWKISEIPGLEGCIKNPFNGRYLYRSLLIHILDEIYTGRSIDISDIDISIVQGKSDMELFAVARLLSPLVKYMTIIAGNKKPVEEEAERIYTDTGMPVRVTADYRSGLKDADLVINLGSLKELTSNLKANSKAVILNFQESKEADSSSVNTIINGVEIKLERSILPKIGGDVFRYFDKLEICEIILSHKINSEEKVAEGLFDCMLMGKISEEFKKNGYVITGFVGKHGILRIEEIELPAGIKGRVR